MINKLQSLFYIYSSTFFSFLTSLYLAKQLGDKLYGFIALGVAIGAIVQIVINFGMDKSLLREVTSLDKGEDVNSVIASFICKRLIIFIFTSLLISSVYLFLFFTRENEFENYALALLIGYIIFQSLLGLYPKGAFEYIEKISTQNKILFLERFLIFIFVYAFFELFGSSNILHLVFLMVLVRVISISTQLKVIGVFNSLHKNIFLNLKPETIGGGYITIALLFNSLIYYGMQLIVPLSHGLDEVSSIGVALQFCLIVTITQTQVCRYLNKSIFLDKFKEHLNKKIMQMFFLSIPLALLYVLAIHVCKEFYLVDGYKNLTSHSYFLAVWLVLLGPGLVINQYVIAKKLDNIYMKISMCSSFLCLFISYIISTYSEVYLISLSLLIPHCVSMLVQYMELYRSEYEKVC